MGQNSTTKHLKFLKKIVNLAVANGNMAYNPLNIYKVEREPVEIDFLDEEELRRIINFDTPILRFERAKDMFLFGCLYCCFYLYFLCLLFIFSYIVDYYTHKDFKEQKKE